MKTKTRIKLIGLAIFAVLLGIFISLNTKPVEMNLIFGTVSMSRSLLLICVLAGGFILGWTTRSLQAVRNWAEDHKS